MINTKKLLQMILLSLVVLGLSFLLLQPVSYSSSLVDNARHESGPRPPTYGADDPGGGGPSGTPGSSSGNVTITRDWYREISGIVYERTDNASEIGGVEVPRIGIARSKSNCIQ